MHGRLTTLNKLKADRDNYGLPKIVRKRADDAMKKIIVQLKDRKLMAMRERLIRASLAGDHHEVWKIQNLMKAHEGLELEKHE